MVEKQVERWGVFELRLQGSQEGNPFLDVSLTGEFRMGHRIVSVNGFYDGNGEYVLRFMPDEEGVWRYLTKSNRVGLDNLSGQFTCVAPSASNHGPVRVRNTYHFAYGDGTAYFPFGTTCYAWNHQGERLEKQTLETLENAPFNKIRMCVFPKHYDFNHNEPEYYPFEGSPQAGWDFSRFNPCYFRHLEKRVAGLMALGIEADLILFHPYDRWGFATMSQDVNGRYLRYVVTRLSPYRNVWWSMANEYDFMENMEMGDWDRLFRLVQQYDPCQHLRSIHNAFGFYDHGKPWVTHCSVQNSELTKVNEWRELYGKPVVVDECCYEGDINHDWGNITAQEMTHRFWEGVWRGGYVGHGETYLTADETLWWSKGGILRGESPARIAFLRRILEEGPACGLTPSRNRWGVTHGGADGYLLLYFGFRQPSFKVVELPETGRFELDVIDCWNMTITTLPGTHSGKIRVELPRRQYMALRARRVAGVE